MIISYKSFIYFALCVFVVVLLQCVVLCWLDMTVLMFWAIQTAKHN